MIWKCLIILSIVAHIWQIGCLKSLSKEVRNILKVYQHRLYLEHFLMKRFKEGETHGKIKEKNDDISK